MTRALLVLLVACSSKSDDQPAPQQTVVVFDAGVDGITTIVPFDPASGMHLDEGSSAKLPPARRAKLPGVAIGISLRSEPLGADVSVDGEKLGPTPQYWTGVADGSEHTFGFTMPNFALAHYKFVPIQSGVIFATLQRVSLGDTPDAGFSTTPPAIDAAPVVRPPPTVLDKPDATPMIDAAEAGSAPGPQP